jgi:hypothetical protein
MMFIKTLQVKVYRSKFLQTLYYARLNIISKQLPKTHISFFENMKLDKQLKRLKYEHRTN